MTTSSCSRYLLGSTPLLHPAGIFRVSHWLGVIGIGAGAMKACVPSMAVEVVGMTGMVKSHAVRDITSQVDKCGAMYPHSLAPKGNGPVPLHVDVEGPRPTPGNTLHRWQPQLQLMRSFSVKLRQRSKGCIQHVEPVKHVVAPLTQPSPPVTTRVVPLAPDTGFHGVDSAMSMVTIHRQVS
jgi:hypothetical protein